MRISVQSRNIKDILSVGYFAPKSWRFWRALILCFITCAMLGHALEYPYCWVLAKLFGIVGDTYNVFTDPWFIPYWVYGFGALAMTLVLEPLKEHIVRRRKTFRGALLESFVMTVAIAAVLEVVFGLLINQPNAAGDYPYRNNSQLPGNILQQGWIVNDVVIGLVAMIYIWGIYPLFCWALEHIPDRTANIVFVVAVVFFAGCCIADRVPNVGVRRDLT